MKIKYLFITPLLFLSSFLLAQDNTFSCGTEIPDSPQYRVTHFDNPIYSGSTDPAYLATFPQMSFDIYYWIINRSDGSNDWGTITKSDVLENMERINDLFRPMGICFVLKGFGTINNTTFYENSYIFGIPNYIPNCFNVYVPRTLYTGQGVTNIGANRLGINMVNFYGMWHISEGNALAHELAHDFGLLHLWGSANDTVNTQEHVERDPESPNFNALSKGDLVADTPAMVSFYGEAAQIDGTISDIVNFDDCTYMGTGADVLGVPFQITPTDVGNVMAYTYAPCINNFRTGQGIRIREWMADPANANKPSMSAKRADVKNVDLYIRDTAEDFGEEPNTLSQTVWNCPDIWVRNQVDNGTEHQNPEYDPVTPNYVHVKVGNRGCSTSSGNNYLKLYWAKASTSVAWDFNWTGNTFENGALMGNLIGTVEIPPIGSNKEIVLTIPWENMPNPLDYLTINPESWHFCLLARIVSDDDPMTVSEGEWIGTNIVNNNNIALKNVSIIDVQPDSLGTSIGGVVAVGNVFPDIREYSLDFVPDTKEIGKKIFEEAEVSITLDEKLLRAWFDGGKLGNDIKLTDDNKIIVTGHDARLDRIKLRPSEIGTLNLQFNFLIKEITNKDHFTYHVIQKDILTNRVVSGETYEIQKHTRNLFYADAGGDKETDKYVPITLSAEDINEPALYNWYDNDGNLVYEGLTFSVFVEAAKKYKLEVIALSDGYKDYSEIEVKLRPNAISSISPNPTNHHSTFTYKINEGSTAYLSINPLYTSNGISQNYVLNISEQETTIDLSNYQPGIYLVTLITDGQISDTKYIIKQ